LLEKVKNGDPKTLKNILDFAEGRTTPAPGQRRTGSNRREIPLPEGMTIFEFYEGGVA
jgi:hypothetical protein